MGTIERDCLLDALTEGIETLTTSERWRTHLEVQGRFHHYSFNNALLIGAQEKQRPDVAFALRFGHFSGQKFCDRGTLHQAIRIRLTHFELTLAEGDKGAEILPI